MNCILLALNHASLIWNIHLLPSFLLKEMLLKLNGTQFCQGDFSKRHLFSIVNWHTYLATSSESRADKAWVMTFLSFLDDLSRILLNSRQPTQYLSISMVTIVEFQGEVKYNTFLHPNEPPQRILWYLGRQLEVELSHNFTK